MKNKRTVIFILALIMVGTASINVWAAEQPVQSAMSDNVITPRWTNTESISLDLSFSGNKANCSAVVIGKTGITKITATVKLQRKNCNGTYTTVKTWSGLSANGPVLTFNNSHKVSSAYTYRLIINAAVYKGGCVENVSKSVEKYCS